MQSPILKQSRQSLTLTLNEPQQEQKYADAKKELSFDFQAIDLPSFESIVENNESFLLFIDLKKEICINSYEN